MSEEKPMTLIQELRGIEGALAMSREYRMAMIIKKTMEYILKMEAHLNELEKGKEDDEATDETVTLD